MTTTLTAPPEATGPADGGTTTTAPTPTATDPASSAPGTVPPSSPQAPPSSWTPEPVPTVTTTVTVQPAPAQPTQPTGTAPAQPPSASVPTSTPTATPSPLRPAGHVAGPGWATIVGSYAKGRYSLDAVYAEADRIGGALTVVDSSATPGMNPGYWAIVAAVSATKDEAEGRCAGLASRGLQDCYARRLR